MQELKGQKPDGGADGNRDDPGADDFAHGLPANGTRAPRHADAGDGAGNDVRG